MKKIKRMLASLLVILLALTSVLFQGFDEYDFQLSDLSQPFAFKTNAVDDIRQGKAGDNINWSINLTTGEMVMSGTGDLPHYTQYQYRPYTNYSKNVTKATVEEGITNVGSNIFCYFENLREVTLPLSATWVGIYAFNKCYLIENVDIPNATLISTHAFYSCYNLKKVNIGDKLERINTYAFGGCTSLESLYLPKSLSVVESSAFYGCSNLKDIFYGGTEEEWKKISIGSGNECLTNATIHYDIYNLGDETYSFKNFGDVDSKGGHCFGMSITSSGYHTGILDISNIGGNLSTPLYSLSKTVSVKEPICYYQGAQGKARERATVAGGSYYLSWLHTSNIEKDWKEVISYVKDHSYDNLGILQVAIRGKEGGHAINFLRYEKINGQDRIYVYDNNFPNIETYIYKAEDGTIRQAPYSTFSGALSCIALRNISQYLLDVRANYKKSRCFYANNLEIAIENATMYEMECGEGDDQVMFELSEDVKEVKITPLIDNATFVYMGEEYSFGSVEETEYAVFTMSSSEDKPTDTDFVIVEHNHTDENQDGICDTCNKDNTVGCTCKCHKTGIVNFFFKIINFFQKLFGQNKTCTCGVAH